MEITGKIIAVLPLKKGTSKTTGNEWQVQSYVIETENEHPARLCFEVFGAERIEQFALSLGMVATISFDVDSHEYNGKWYNQVRAWKVENISSPAPEPQPVASRPQQPKQNSMFPDVQPIQHPAQPYEDFPF